MKKQLALALALASLLVTSCDDEASVNPSNRFRTNIQPAAVIHYIYPNVGAGGSMVAIHGENFGDSIGDNSVTFGSTSAAITYIGPGTIHVRVPMNLEDGSYAIKLIASGSVATAPHPFTVINSRR